MSECDFCGAGHGMHRAGCQVVPIPPRARLPVAPPGTPGPPKVYCDGACCSRAHSRDSRAATAARGPRVRYCYRCGRTFSTPRVGRPRITCSATCARRRGYALWKARTRGKPDLFTAMEER